MKYDKLIEILEKVHEQMQFRAARSVDLALVVRNWLFGLYLVEYEQNGEDRALYGSKLIDSVSKELSDKKIKGISPTNLRKFREFYISYKQIQQTLSVKSLVSADISATDIIQQSLTVELAKQFKLSWTH
jgi:hypothetical protein